MHRFGGFKIFIWKIYISVISVTLVYEYLTLKSYNVLHTPLTLNGCQTTTKHQNIIFKMDEILKLKMELLINYKLLLLVSFDQC